MAAFASCRRSGAVRVLVLLLCALFIFSTLGAPPAQALGVESVAVFGLASVLSAATAALGFKLASNEQGQATLQKMVQDFKTVAWATGFVLVGSKLNGLQNGMDYIKMQVQNGKTYLDSRVFAWVQQWLAQNGVYDEGGLEFIYSDGGSVTVPFNGAIFWQSRLDSFTLNKSSLNDAYSRAISDASYLLPLIVEHYNLNSTDCVYYVSIHANYMAVDKTYVTVYRKDLPFTLSRYVTPSTTYFANEPYYTVSTGDSYTARYGASYNGSSITWDSYSYLDSPCSRSVGSSNGVDINLNYGIGVSSISNETGLSGTDTLGKDVIDLTLDQILQKLKEWAQDWFDAGADSATNAATGAQDLPLTVATGAATANPSIAEDGPLVWFPSFGVPIPTLRTGETDTNTVDQGKENANTADKTEAAAGTVEETQTIVDSLLNWALDYISPDKGLFSKFPLCIPYDAYLLVCSALGVDALGVDDVVGSSPGDVQSVMGSGVEVYSNFQPVINFKHELKAGGTTYPIAFTLDLSPFEPIVKLNRIFVTVYVLAELIASEYKRIRSS